MIHQRGSSMSTHKMTLDFIRDSFTLSLMFLFVLFYINMKIKIT